MRITLNMQNSETLLNINNQEEQINQLSQSIASGKKFSSPSDDPCAWAQAMNVQQGLRECTSISNNLNFATGWEQATGSALNSLSNLVSQAKQVAISAGSATGTSQSTALASELGGILQQVLSLANSQYGGQYIFAGSATGSAPFSIDTSTGVVTYNGDSNAIKVRTSVSDGTDDKLSTVNLTGGDVFTYTSGGKTLNVLNQIWQLQQAVSSGDSSAVSNSINALGDAFDSINNESTINGGRLSELSTRQSAIGVLQTNGQSELSNLQDTDVAQAATRLEQAQTAFQAALKVAGSLSSLNLAEFLGSSATG